MVERARDEAIKPLILEQLCTTRPAALPPIGITRLSQFRHSPHITDSSHPAAQELKGKQYSPLLAEMSKCFPSPLFPVLLKTRSQSGAGKEKRVEGRGRQGARVEARAGARIPRWTRGRRDERELQAGDSSLLLQSVPFSSWQQPTPQQTS